MLLVNEKMVSEGIGALRAKEFEEWLRLKHQREKKESEKRRRQKKSTKIITPSKDVLGLRYGKEILLSKANVSVEMTLSRDDPMWYAFRNYILKRDDFKCLACGNKSALHIHHIVPVSENPNLMYDEDNCLTLCSKCHRKKHPNNNLFF